MKPSERFQAASAHVKQLPSTPASADLLRLYALFKQVTKGDCAGERPGAFSVQARAKWDAWNGLRGTARGEAQERYVVLVKDLDPAWSPPPPPAAEEEEDEEDDDDDDDDDEEEEGDEDKHGGGANEDTGGDTSHGGAVEQRASRQQPSRRHASSPQRRRVQSSYGSKTPTGRVADAADAAGPSSHQRGATWSPNTTASALTPSAPLTPTFVRSIKNVDHTAYLISVSYSRLLDTLAGGPRTRVASVQSNGSDDIPDSAEAYFDKGEGEDKNGGDAEWHITARYSDFVRLHDDLLSRGGFREDDLPSLPPKKWLFNQDPNFVQTRMDELQQYTSLLLLDPRIANNVIVAAFFKVAENLMMLRTAEGKPEYGGSQTRARTVTSSANAPATAPGLQSGPSSNISGSNMMSPAEGSKTAASSARFDSPGPLPPTEGRPESVSETEQIVPVELVALDADANVLHAANIKFWKQESFLTLPWVHRNSNLELRFQGGMYALFNATDKTSRGERTLQLLRRRKGGGDAGAGTPKPESEEELPRQPGQITLRVRLRTNRVKGGLSPSPSSSPQASPNGKRRGGGGRGGGGEGSGSGTEKPLLQQVLLLSVGFVFASVLSWLAFRYEAPLATTMSLPLLPIALVLGWVFGDSPKNLSDASYRAQRKTNEMFLNVGIQITSYMPAENADGGGGGAPSGQGGAGGGGAASKNLPRYIDMTGNWTVDYTLSKTTIEPMTKALGVPWIARKALNALTFTTVIKHTPDHFDRFDKLKGNRVGKEQPAYKLDGKPCKVEDENGFVDVRCWSDPAEAKVTVETTIPETPKNIGALLTDSLTLEHDGEWLHQRITVVTKGSTEPVFVDRILKRVEGKPVEGPGLWA